MRPSNPREPLKKEISEYLSKTLKHLQRKILGNFDKMISFKLIELRFSLENIYEGTQKEIPFNQICDSKYKVNIPDNGHKIHFIF